MHAHPCATVSLWCWSWVIAKLWSAQLIVCPEQSTMTVSNCTARCGSGSSLEHLSEEKVSSPGSSVCWLVDPALTKAAEWIPTIFLRFSISPGQFQLSYSSTPSLQLIVDNRLLLADYQTQEYINKCPTVTHRREVWTKKVWSYFPFKTYV